MKERKEDRDKMETKLLEKASDFLKRKKKKKKKAPPVEPVAAQPQVEPPTAENEGNVADEKGVEAQPVV